MSWRALIFGLVLGFGIGWLVLGSRGDPEPVALTDASAPAARPAAPVPAMRRRRIDVSGLESILDAPLETLRRTAGGEERAGPGSASAYRAMYAIEYNPALWSEEAAMALEAAGRAIAGKSAAAGNMLEGAKEVRARIRSPWRTE